MSLIFPVAASGLAALTAPLGFAARARDAAKLLGAGEVEFATDWVGEAFTSEEALRAFFGERVDGSSWQKIEPVALIDGAQPRRPSQALAPKPPVFQGGRRWPEPQSTVQLGYRLSVRYWRLATVAPLPSPTQQARKLRSAKRAKDALDTNVLQALVAQPLRGLRPQRALDIGLFETSPPEAPHILMPDE